MKASGKVDHTSLLQDKYFQKIFVLLNTAKLCRLKMMDGEGPLGSLLNLVLSLLLIAKHKLN